MLDAFDHRDGEWFAEIATREERTRRRRQRLCCARCAYLLTPAPRSVRIAGAARHVCENPAGLRFELRLFAAVPGLSAQGPAETADSWFPPYRWQIGSCGGCGRHLGWYFAAAAGAFCALIESRFVVEGAQ